MDLLQSFYQSVQAGGSVLYSIAFLPWSKLYNAYTSLMEGRILVGFSEPGLLQLYQCVYV